MSSLAPSTPRRPLKRLIRGSEQAKQPSTLREIEDASENDRSDVDELLPLPTKHTTSSQANVLRRLEATPRTPGGRRALPYAEDSDDSFVVPDDFIELDSDSDNLPDDDSEDDVLSKRFTDTLTIKGDSDEYGKEDVNFPKRPKDADTSKVKKSRDRIAPPVGPPKDALAVEYDSNEDGGNREELEKPLSRSVAKRGKLSSNGGSVRLEDFLTISSSHDSSSDAEELPKRCSAVFVSEIGSESESDFGRRRLKNGAETEDKNKLHQPDYAQHLDPFAHDLLNDPADDPDFGKTRPAAKRKPRTKDQEKKRFMKIRNSLALAFIKVLDERVAAGKISELYAQTGGAKLEWNNGLRSTAGRAYHRRVRLENGESQASGTIELAPRIITEKHQLYDTLAHEFCHLLTMGISQQMDRPHLGEFKVWGRKCEQALLEYDLRVETCHNYDLHHKYHWACQCCGYVYKRFSKSIDSTKNRCGRCRGSLLQTLPKPRNTGPSQYTTFVKDNYSRIAAENPATPRKEMLKLVASEYRRTVGATAKMTPANGPEPGVARNLAEMFDGLKV